MSAAAAAFEGSKNKIKKIKKNPKKVLTKHRVCGIILNVAGKDGQATGA